MKPAVEMEGVGFRRGKATLLEDASFSVLGGDMFGIIGPNGAGKSTLLRILAGDLVPSQGWARLAGIDPSRTKPLDLAARRAYLGPDGFSPSPFSVRQIVAMGRHPHRRALPGEHRHDQVVVEAMEATDVHHLAHRALENLSTGERQRVGLARVIAQATPSLLLDEPTSSLDIGHQERIMALLGSLARKGAAVIVVLHDLNLAAAHCDRLLLLDRGRTVALGSPGQVLEAETLTSVYQQPMRVVPHPHRDCPLVLSVGEAR